MLVLGTAITVAVPALTVPHLPSVSPWPILLGLIPWVFGKYVLCPLRWRVLTAACPDGRRSRGWFLRASAESELLGLLTPGHVGADAWRYHRLTRGGWTRGDALTSIGADRVVGAIGLAAFVLFAASSLPSRMLVLAGVIGVAMLLTGLVVRRMRPDLLRFGPMPRPRQLLAALLLAAAYQLTIAGLLLGAVDATGHSLSPLSLLGAFGASQVAAVVPGPNGASPRDGALVVALVALGLPWVAAAAVVTLKSLLAWLPALALGGLSLLLWRRQSRAVELAA
ncbi:lysylphosphatidylglycerol synthase domain-containing protein [Marmoricola sp. URHA0025 HA25]